MARKSTIGRNPLDMLIPAKPATKAKQTVRKAGPKREPEPAAERERLTVQVGLETVERARNAAYWERTPLAQLVEEGLKMVVDKLERQRGEVYAEREQALRVGRPLKRR